MTELEERLEVLREANRQRGIILAMWLRGIATSVETGRMEVPNNSSAYLNWGAKELEPMRGTSASFVLEIE